MATNNATTLQCSSVNSGTAIDMRATKVDFSIGLNVNTAPYPDRTDPGEVDEIGVGTFGFTVQGIIDRDDSTSNIMTFALLEALVASRKVMKFYHDAFTNEAYATTPWKQSGGVVNVRIASIKGGNNSRQEDGHIIAYSMNLVVTEEAYA